MIQLTDNTGASTGVYYYDPYGSQLSGSTPITDNLFTYTGREDDGTGLYYYRNRYYDPLLEVFINQDPLGDAQRYVAGNPIVLPDPLGLDPNINLVPHGFNATASNNRLYNNANKWVTKRDAITAMFGHPYTVVAHGSYDGFNLVVGNDKQPMSAERLSKLILSDPNFLNNPGPIELLVCLSGAFPNRFAQQLANILNQLVIAPNDLIYFPENKYPYIDSDGSGWMNNFRPLNRNNN